MRLFVVVASRADERCTEEDLVAMLEWNRERISEAHFVITEWGDPVAGRRHLDEALRDAKIPSTVIRVPSVLADRHQSPGFWGEYAAKNVGLRLIEDFFTGGFVPDPLVVVTNLDCYFSEPLCEALRVVSAACDPDALYRAPRYTFHEGRLPPDEREPWRAPLWSRVDIGKWGGEAAGDFCGMALSSWRSLCGYAESPFRQGHLDSELTDRALHHKRKLVDLGHPVCHRAHENRWSKVASSLDAPYTPVAERGLRKHQFSAPMWDRPAVVGVLP